MCDILLSLDGSEYSCAEEPLSLDSRDTEPDYSGSGT